MGSTSVKCGHGQYTEQRQELLSALQVGLAGVGWGRGCEAQHGALRLLLQAGWELLSCGAGV